MRASDSAVPPAPPVAPPAPPASPDNPVPIREPAETPPEELPPNPPEAPPAPPIVARASGAPGRV
jgi:hypothetical protein